ncbi:MAG: ABC transporter ATP-binding protein [Christensenellales bacterium]
MEKNLLEICDLNLSYHTKKSETLALKDLSFYVKTNELVSIVGPSGCGKTTILSIIAGLLSPSSGSVILDNKSVSGVTQDIGYMFQKDNLFNWLTVEDNVMFGLKLQKRLTEENKSIVYSLVEKYGLTEFLHHYPTQLSGGMRQRVSLIRTLALNPKLLLLDEPFSALDYQTRLKIQDIVFNIMKAEHKTALMVTHDIGEAIAMSDRIIILTKRPASVKKIIELDFPAELSPFERRNDSKFKEYFNEIWEELMT